MPHEAVVSTALFGEVVEEATSGERELIIWADMNTHDTIWGRTDIINSGKSLHDFILTINLTICNIGKEPTITIKDRQEVHDVNVFLLDF